MDAFIAGWLYSRQMERDIMIVSKSEAVLHLRFSAPPLMRQRPDEYMIFQASRDDIKRIIREADVDRPHLLTVFTNDPQATLDTYAQYHYLLFAREYLMAVALEPKRFSTAGDVVVRRVSSEAERQWFNRAREREVIPPHALGDPRLSYYYVRHGDLLICEGRCILTPDKIAVVDSIYTAEAYRRRGLGAALMRTMLNDAAQRGAQYSALAASDDGRQLYLTLGYTVLADMLSLELVK
jgi:GNAT superfamily N-acetyltransferase